MKKIFILQCLLLLWFVDVSVTDNRTTLNIAVLIPFENVDNSCNRHAIELAVEDVNNADEVITDGTKQIYRLQAHFMTTGESDGNAIEALYRSYSNGSLKISTIGPPYKDQNEYCAEYSTAQANLHISYTEPHEPLEPYLLMFYPSTPSIIAAFQAARAVLKYFNWTQVGILYDYSDTRYRKNADNLRIILEKKDSSNKTVEVLSAQGIWSSPSEYSVSAELNALQVQGARIIFAMISVNGARKVFCEAYKQGIIKPKVTWFLYEKLPAGWASDKYNNDLSDITKREIDCSEEQLLAASRGYISIVKQGVRRDGKETIGKQTKESYERRLAEKSNYAQCNEDSAYAYDSIWVLAQTYKIYGATTKLSDYYYHNFKFAVQIGRAVKNVKFEGITGPLSYQAHREISSVFLRFGQISMWSHPNDKTDIFIGSHDTSLKNLTFTTNVNSKLFDQGIIPKDKASYVLTFANFSEALFITMWVISILGIILAIGFLLITVCYMGDKNLNIDSSMINAVIVVGCIICYLSVIAYGVDTRFVTAERIPDTCWSFLILISVGFTLTFGSLFAKAWQLYKIYMTPEVKVTNINPKPIKTIPNAFLYLIIGGLVVIDGIIITTWYLVSPFEHVVKNVTTTENLFADTIFIEQIAGCTCKNESEFIIGMYCYKGLLLIFGIFLAWQTRNAKIKIQNESKQIAMAIYNVVAVSLIGVICVSVLANTTRYEASYAIIAVCICICNTTTLLLVFLPKLRQIMLYDGSSATTDNKTSPPGRSTGKYSLSYMRKKTKTSADSSHTASTVTLSTQVSTDNQIQASSPHQSPPPASPIATSLPQANGHIDNSPANGSVSSDQNLFMSSQSYMVPPAYESNGGVQMADETNINNDEHLPSGIYVGSRLSSTLEEDEVHDSVA